MEPADFDKLCHLARLALSPEEKERLRGQVGSVLDYVRQIQELDTSKVEPMSHPLDLSNVHRADEPKPGLSSAEALSNAPQRIWEFFGIPQMMED